jgi:uroporphyrinogen decarboxylase
VLPRERVLAALRREPIDRVPYVETTIGLGIGEKLLGRTFPLVPVPQLGLNLRHWKDDKRLSRLLHRDNISFRLLPPTFSKKEKGKEGQLFVGDGLIKTMDDFRNMFSLPDPQDDSLYEPIKPILERRDEFAVIFSTRLGFLSALISIGFQTFMESLYLNPELIDAALGAYVDWSAKVLRRICEMGVDAIFTTDDFAFNSGPFMSPASFRQWVVPYHQRAIKEITVPWVLHTDGEIHRILDDLFGMGIQGIHPIDPNCMDIREFKKNHGKRVCILGNVNVNTLATGTPEEVYSEVRDLIRDLGPGYGYILSSGNSVPDYAKPENMLALARALEDFAKYEP